MRYIAKYFKPIISRIPFLDVFCWLYKQRSKAAMYQYSPAMFKEFGCGARVDEDVKINMPDRIIVKDYAVIRSGAIINSQGGLILGKYSAIGYNATIFTGEHKFRGARSIPFDDTVFLKPVVIGDFVMMGVNVSIAPGVEIGEGAILGMGSVVTDNVPSCAIVIGNPAKIIGYRSKDHFEKMVQEEKFQFQIIPHYKEVIMPVHRKRRKHIYEHLGIWDV